MTLQIEGLHQSGYRLGNYAADRDYYLKILENPRLFRNPQDRTQLRPVWDGEAIKRNSGKFQGYGIAVGYGFDLVAQNLTTVVSLLEQVHNPLSAADYKLLSKWH